MLERGSLVADGLTDINLRVHSNLVLSRVTDQTLCISEGNLGEGETLANSQSKPEGRERQGNRILLTKDGVVRLP